MMRLKPTIYILYALSLFALPVCAQQPVPTALQTAVDAYFRAYHVEGYRPFRSFAADSIKVFEEERSLEVYTNDPFFSQPFTPERVDYIYTSFQQALPQPYNAYELTLYGKDGLSIEQLIPNAYLAAQAEQTRLWGETDYSGQPWVQNISRFSFYKPGNGLAGRTLMVTPSHGRYWREGLWRWQRPELFCTTEDLFTQSFVFPFLIPMLENAGATVCTARERDYQTATVVVDNDNPNQGGLYMEVNGEGYPAWSSTADSSAFANPANGLRDGINPFRLGTARYVPLTTDNTEKAGKVKWIPNIPEAGNYAVYVSYATLPNSTDAARYTIYHAGGKTEFRVNQQIGGGTWVYLGTFRFPAGQNPESRVELIANGGVGRGVVTADAVRFGGGVGQTRRTGGTTTGLPRFLEGARYYAQWAGAPDSIYITSDTSADNDYYDDIRSRSNFLNYLGGGSVYMPHRQGLRVPIELSLAFHSDAGWRSDATPYGTLAICTSHDDAGNTVYGSGLSRRASADFANLLIENCVSDVAATFNKDWPRREMWDRSYAESRMPDVPSAILESMSHQNFTDLKYGHDPTFKFTFSRAVYKAILRFVTTAHGQTLGEKSVQPLPPHAFSITFDPLEKSRLELSWLPTADPLEPKAAPIGYKIYVSVDGSDFMPLTQIDNGICTLKQEIKKGVRYAFRVTAFNNGGESFPSETLSAYISPQEQARVLIVNGFDRLSGPAWVDTPERQGFDLDEDIGISYIRNASFCGRQRCFDPSQAGKEGEGALGFSGNELQGRIIAGNTFDYPVAHGDAIAACDYYSYVSMSREAAESCDWKGYDVVDYIAGLNRDVPYNLRTYRAIPSAVQRRMAEYSAAGGNLFVSGAYVVSDFKTLDELHFAQNTLHCKADSLLRNIPSTAEGFTLTLPVFNTPCEAHYALQSADVLNPVSDGAFTAMLYGSGQSAAVAWKGTHGASFVSAIPLECIADKRLRADAMYAILSFLTGK